MKQTPEPGTCTLKMQKEVAQDDQRWNQGLPINTDTTEKSQEWDSKRSRGSHLERSNKEQAQHQTRKTGGHRVRTWHLFRPKTRRSSNRRRNSSHRGAKTNTAAGDCTISLDELRNEQRVTAPKGRNQKAMSQPERQDKIAESNDSKVTMQQERKTERSLLFMIAAGVVCQTTSHDWYG